MTITYISLMTSPDAITWTPQTTVWDANGFGQSICYDPDLALFVAGGTDGSSGAQVMHSADGVTWTPVAFGTGTIYTMVSAGGVGAGVYKLLAATNGLIAYGSTDATTWTSVTIPLNGAECWTGSDWLTWDFSTSHLESSPTGVTWTSSSPISGPGLLGYHSGLLLSMVPRDGFGNAYVWRSTDGGATWTRSAAISGGSAMNYSRLFWVSALGLWVASGETANVGPNAAVLTSPDGITWTEHTIDTGVQSYCYGIDWNGSLFVAVGMLQAGGSSQRARVWTSPDAVTWTQQTSTPFDPTAYGVLSGVAWNPAVSLWAAVGTGQEPAGYVPPPPPSKSGWSIGSLRIK